MVLLGWLVAAAAGPVVAEPYFSLYTGAAVPDSWSVKDSSPFGADVEHWDFKVSPTVGGKLGYWVDQFPALGIETEVYGRFHDFGPKKVKIGGLETDIRAETESVDVGFNALMRLPWGPLRPYGGAGLGIHVVEIGNIKLSAPRLARRTSTTLGGDTDVTKGLQLLGGLQWEVVEGAAIGVEYKYLRHNLKFKDPDVALSMEAEDHLFTGGFTFYFRKPFGDILRNLLP